MAYRSPEQRLRDLPDDFADEPGLDRLQPRPEQALAAAIVAQAVADARNARLPVTVRLGAAAFLQNSHLLRFWGRVANLNADAVAQLARQVLDEATTRRRQLRVVRGDRRAPRALLTPDDPTPPEAA